MTITVAGPLGRNDAAILSRQLHTALDEHVGVIVLNLSRVPACDPAGLEVLTVARSRARDAGAGLHIVDLRGPECHDWLADAGLS